MPPSHEQDRADLQRAIDALPNGGTLRLTPREYPGPLVISRSVMLDGNGSTIWAARGPVVFCQASKVVLRDLRVEVTTEAASDTEDHCALKVNSGSHTSLENVEVRGSVIGLPQEEGDWRYPNTLQLGSVPFGIEHDVIIRLWVPVPCQISSRISGIEIQPNNLEPGTNEVTLHVERIGKDTLLSGTLYISTPQLKRSIVVNGHVSKTGQKKSRAKRPAQIIWEPPDWEALLAMPRPVYAAPLPPPPPSSPNPSEVIYGAPAPPPQPTANSTLPEEMSQPSGPSFQWPPAPVIPLTPGPPPSALAPPPPPAPVPAPPITRTPPPLTPPPPVSATGGSSVVLPPGSVAVSPPSGPVAGPVSNWLRKPAVVVGGIVVALLVLALAGWWIFFSGPIRIDYEGVVFRWSGTGGDEMRAVAFSPDSSLIAGGGKDGVVRIWDASSGDLKREMKSADTALLSEITSLVFSPDGTMLASGRADTNVILWDPKTGKQITSLKGHLERVNSVAFSSDGQFVASGGDDKNVKLWNPRSIGAQPKTLYLGVPVKAVGFSHDGTMVAGAGGSDKGVLKIWKTADGQPQGTEIGKDAVITSLAFSKDGKLVLGVADSTVALWNVDKKTQVNTFRGHKSQVNGVAFSPLGESIVTGGADNLLLLWTADAYGSFKRQLSENSAPVYAVAVSPDGRLIASAGADRTVKVWTNK